MDQPNPKGGPKTAKGKSISSKNAVKHGLSSKNAVIEDEDKLDYEAVRAGLLRRLDPQDSLELELVNHIIDSAWRLRRVVDMERLSISHNLKEAQEQYGHTDSPSQLLARAYARTRFDLLGRYEARIERGMYKCLAILDKLQKKRIEADNMGEMALPQKKFAKRT